MEWILNQYLMTTFVHVLPDSRVVKMSQKPTLEYNLQKISEHTHQISEINIYRGDTEYDCQIYEQLWIIQHK